MWLREEPTGSKTGSRRNKQLVWDVPVPLPVHSPSQNCTSTGRNGSSITARPGSQNQPKPYAVLSHWSRGDDGRAHLSFIDFAPPLLFWRGPDWPSSEACSPGSVDQAHLDGSPSLWDYVKPNTEQTNARLAQDTHLGLQGKGRNDRRLVGHTTSRVMKVLRCEENDTIRKPLGKILFDLVRVRSTSLTRTRSACRGISATQSRGLPEAEPFLQVSEI